MENKNHVLKCVLACVMVVVMAVTAVPMSGFVGLELPKWSEMFAMRASAATSGYYTYTVSKGEAMITGCDDSIKGDVVIPATLGGYSVTSIGYESFYGCTELTSITIPDSVTSVGTSAFEDCTGLKNITIPDDVTRIGEGAFYNTAWYNAQPNGNVYVGKFYYEYKGTMPKNTSIVIKKGTRGIADTAFINCAARLSGVTIPDGLISIGSNAFAGCTGLTNVTIPDSVVNMNVGVFYECTGLTSVTIGNGIKTIPEYAFCFCPLTTIKIGKNVKTIGWAAFCGVKRNADVYYAGSQAQWKKITIDEENDDLLNATFHFNFNPNHTHTYTAKVTKKSTDSAAGIMNYTCSCGDSYTKSIPKIASVTLSATTYIYDGKVKNPTVTVTDSAGKKLVKGTDYTITASSGRTNVGKYIVKVTFIGKYSGSKTMYFYVRPGTTSSISATSSTSAIKLTWKAVPGTTGYSVYYYSTSAKGYKKLKDVRSTTYTVSGLKSGTSYKFAVKAFAKVESTVYQADGYKTFTTSTKPGTPTLTVTAGAKKATLKWNAQIGATGYVVYAATSKTGKYTKIATVKGGTSVSYTKTGLTTGKTYYFKIAAYTTSGGSTIYGAYSPVKGVKVK